MYTLSLTLYTHTHTYARVHIHMYIIEHLGGHECGSSDIARLQNLIKFGRVELLRARELGARRHLYHSECVCVCVCVCVCLCKCVYTYVDIYHLSVSVSVSVSVSTPHTQAHTRAHTHTHTHVITFMARSMFWRLPCRYLITLASSICTCITCPSLVVVKACVHAPVSKDSC